MKCKYFEKDKKEKYCKNFIGCNIIGMYESGTIIKENCKEKCVKYIEDVEKE